MASPISGFGGADEPRRLRLIVFFIWFCSLFCFNHRAIQFSPYSVF